MRYFRYLAQSLSVKLIVIFFITAITLVWVLWVSLGISFEQQFSYNVKPYFSNYLISLQKEVGFPPDISIAQRITEKAPVNIVIEAPGYSWSSNGDFIETPYLDVKVQRIGIQGLVSEAGFYKGNFILRTFNQGYITSFIITDKLNKNQLPKAILIAATVILLIISILYMMIYWLFRPVSIIEKGIKRIGDGDIAYRLNIHRSDEIGSLASSINKMADNIEQMLEAKRQLLLAISHELRTPITRSKIALSLLNDTKTKESVVEDMNEMETLIYELLESEKLKENHAPLDLNIVDINDIIYQVQGRFFEHSPIILNLDEHLPLIEVDASRIGLAIKNIIKNALTASLRPDDNVVVTSRYKEKHDEKQLVISVADSGVGIEKDKIIHLTEPFYRIDSSRQRATGGFGIGLHLIKAIVDAHQGDLVIDSHLNQGTVVSIFLPLSPQRLS